MTNVLIYESIWNITDRLSDEQTGKLFKAINAWRKNIEVDFDDQLLEGIWLGIEPNLLSLYDNYQKKVEANKANGKKGGRPKTDNNPNNPSGLSETHTNPKNLKEKDKDKEKDKEKEIDIDKFEFDIYNKETQSLVEQYLK